ncbi:unnamed protein product [Durusdinium trenchii]|uniref:Uncharacterized protein n=1 Tax=Durusdinium trenchii TaxID=1381693 RepID=A0ABP0Q1H9_9DINO
MPCTCKRVGHSSKVFDAAVFPRPLSNPELTLRSHEMGAAALLGVSCTGNQNVQRDAEIMEEAAHRPRQDLETDILNDPREAIAKALLGALLLKAQMERAKAQMERAARHDRHGSKTLPTVFYNAEGGFHFHVDPCQPAILRDGKRAVECTKSSPTTVLTAEVVQPSSTVDFFIKVGSAEKGISWGFVAGNTSLSTCSGFDDHLLGEREFSNSIGAWCNDSNGVCLRSGEPSGSAPTLSDGSVVGVRFCRGKVFFIDPKGQAFHQCEVKAGVRFGVSMAAQGQCVKIVSTASHEAAHVRYLSPSQKCHGERLLRIGSRVKLPDASDQRLQNMRVQWNFMMHGHCGKLGEVVECNQRCVKVAVDDTAFFWDIEVFDSTNKRCCHHGCQLVEEKVPGPTSGRVCDACHTYIPCGALDHRCVAHDYDLCHYCNGAPVVPKVGSRVIRGPTWKWGRQDGAAHEEGTVTGRVDSDGWLKVEWDAGTKNSYRGPPYQDVTLAHENGLKGKPPFGEQDPLEELKKLLYVVASASQGDAQELPQKTFRETGGFHFWQGLKSISVDETKMVAQCKRQQEATAVTEEVFNADGRYDFVVRLNCAHGKGDKDGVIAIGIVDDNPSGFSMHPIGHEAFEGTIGAMCSAEAGAMVHDGKIVGDAPGLVDGDILTIRVEDGTADFLKGSVRFHSVGIKGKFRFGVSMSTPGQCVELVANAPLGQSELLSSYHISEVVLRVEIGSDLKLDRKDPKALLGEGAFGTTWKAGLVTGEGLVDVAVKVLKEDGLSTALRKDFALEVGALASLSLPGGMPHPNLVKLLAIDPQNYAIVTELCLCDLRHHLKSKKGTLNSRAHSKLMRDVACGGAWLAREGYVHRDLKMANVLIAPDGGGFTAKIADFGLARPQVQKLQPQGTVLVMSPEGFEGHFSEKSDVYSFSYIILGTFNEEEVDETCFLDRSDQVLEGMPKQQKLIQAIKSGKRPSVPSKVPRNIVEWIQEAWHPEAPKRPTFEALSLRFRQLL